MRVTVDLATWLAPLRASIPAIDVRAHTTWSSRRRTTYASREEFESGRAPSASVNDVIASIEFSADEPITGIAFSETADGIRWVKAERPAPTIPALLGFSSWVGDDAQMTIHGSLHGATAGGVAFTASGDLRVALVLRDGVVVTGASIPVAEVTGFRCSVVLLPGRVLRTGRNGLWRVDETHSSRLPDELRAMLTHSRTGTLPR